ncbi:putative FmdB family regulatory protein [Actinomycetospora succinea]|uniref:Putative FmdB family regulatory protein n=1 Tax=Actinomycetospora succinea TaxID=663603 RepID=A0A4R6UJB5_9PSEU|nr:zinc ribbon domain-containing protein [Actinomycetospora succinea]TDQ47030.1 putative FmdB family regulatory protein [Actinomycetospora succinea]
MPLYAYRCDEDGPVDVMRPMGAAPPVLACPTCGADAPRMITAPRLRADRARVAAIDRAESSRTEPTVVSAPPPRPAGPRPAPRLDPRTAALPRP